MTKRIIKDNKIQKCKEVMASAEGAQPQPNQETFVPAKTVASERSKSPQISRNPVLSAEGSVPFWKIAVRMGGFLLVVILNVALVMSNLSYYGGVRADTNYLRESFLYTVLFCFNAAILIPAIFEVRWLKIDSDGLHLSTIWWKSKLAWQDILEFRHPSYLKVALIRTRRCFYILNRRDLTGYDRIEAALAEKLK